MESKKSLDRREFLGSAAVPLAFTIVPRHVLGGPRYVAPSDKVTLGYIGCGTQGFREMFRLVANPDIQIVATCDPEKDNTNYVEWSKNDLRNQIRKLLNKPTWGEGVQGVRCGRDVAKEIIETYYAQSRAAEKFKAVNSYADYRELLAKEKDLDAVKVVTPDHHHAGISIAAMLQKKHVICQKPIANRVSEVRMIVETARRTGVATHCSAWRSMQEVNNIREMLRDGAIGNLKDVHNWTDRPFWPHYQSLPTDKPPVPETFDWNLWLGPALDRPYHPHYTHTVFRGWYDFGGGSIADMGNYSLWPIFMTLDLPVPNQLEPLVSSWVEINDQISEVKMNDFSFPISNQVHFKFPSQGGRTFPDLYWYDGGFRPHTPEALRGVAKPPNMATGTMYVGDQGIILGGQIYPEKRRAEYMAGRQAPQSTAPQAGARRRGDDEWVNAFKGGPQSAGNFLNAANCSEAIAVAGVAMRIARKTFNENRTTGPLEYDAQNMRFTNKPEANPYFVREYRKGWELSVL
jgi:predicted dehydrogenase